MKNLLCCFLSMFFALQVFETQAQVSRRFEQNATVDILAGKIPGIGVDYSVGCGVDDVFFVGLGLSVGAWLDSEDVYYSDYWVAPFLQLRATFLPKKEIRPYLSMSAGLDAITAGFRLNPNIGVSIHATKSTKLYLGLGYNVNTVEYDLDDTQMKGVFSAHVGFMF